MFDQIIPTKETLYFVKIHKDGYPVVFPVDYLALNDGISALILQNGRFTQAAVMNKKPWQGLYTKAQLQNEFKDFRFADSME